jgi:hypothetical protein
LSFDIDALRPLIRQVAEEVIAFIRETDERLPDRLAYSEAEAARLLELEEHVLRDERRRGRIGASRIVKDRIRYTRADLLGYLAGRRA